jgi:hypothetical protein
MIFGTDTLLRTWQRDGFRIELHRTQAHPLPSDDDTWVGYRVYDDTWAAATGSDPLIFSGNDLGVLGPTIDLPQAINALCGYFGYRTSDMADRYFNPYTAAQLSWRDARAGALARWCVHGADGAQAAHGVDVDTATAPTNRTSDHERGVTS